MGMRVHTQLHARMHVHVQCTYNVTNTLPGKPLLVSLARPKISFIGVLRRPTSSVVNT